MKNIIIMLLFLFTQSIFSQKIEVNENATTFSLVQEYKIDKDKAFELLDTELKKLGWNVKSNKSDYLFDFPITIPATIRANFATNMSYMIPSNGLIELRDGRYKISLDNIQLNMKKRHKKKVIKSIKENLMYLVKTIDNIIQPKKIKEKDW